MNRQNNLKIIITTVIVLVISAIAIFTVVNWAEIVKKFQGAAAKADGVEKHERNTVPPTNHTNAFVGTNSQDEWKDIPSSKEDTKSPNNTQIDSNSKSPSKEDSPITNTKQKEKDPYGLEEPPIISPKDSGIGYKYKNNDEYPMGNESSVESKNAFSSDKKAKISKTKKYRHKRKLRASKSRVRVKNLDKRVRFLEKKLGVKKPSPKKKPSLENRIYQLEKLIVKKKK